VSPLLWSTASSPSKGLSSRPKPCSKQYGLVSHRKLQTNKTPLRNSTNNAFICPPNANALCAGTSLTQNFIIRCNNGVGTPGNCNDKFVFTLFTRAPLRSFISLTSLNQSRQYPSQGSEAQRALYVVSPPLPHAALSPNPLHTRLHDPTPLTPNPSRPPN
jgi:hypothetical protein